MSLQIIATLYCSACGVYPKEAFWEERTHGRSGYRIWLKLAESGRPVLPEGWVFKVEQLADTMTIFCSLVCAGRELEAEELKDRKAAVWQTHSPLKCDGCAGRAERASGLFYVLPPGWGHPDKHRLFCDLCQQNPPTNRR